MGTHLTTGQIRRLIDIDRLLGGIGDAVEEFIAPYSNCVKHLQWISGEVEVDYGVRPTYAELNDSWFDKVNERFDDTRPELRDLVAKPVPTSGVIKRRFGYVSLSESVTDEQAVAMIAKLRLVPATDLELMYFARAFPDEQSWFPIVALRTFFQIGCLRYSAVLNDKFDEERVLNLCFNATDLSILGEGEETCIQLLVREDVA